MSRHPRRSGARSEHNEAEKAHQPIIAHLAGGPFAGREVALYHARCWYSPPLKRGQVRRMLHLSHRYAWYELGRTWTEHDVLYGEYIWVDVRSERAPRTEIALAGRGE